MSLFLDNPVAAGITQGHPDSPHTFEDSNVWHNAYVEALSVGDIEHAKLVVDAANLAADLDRAIRTGGGVLSAYVNVVVGNLSIRAGKIREVARMHADATLRLHRERREQRVAAERQQTAFAEAAAAA